MNPCRGFSPDTAMHCSVDRDNLCAMPSKVVIFFVALSVELVLDKVSSLPIYTKYVTKGWKMQTDYDHYLERITAFLTILLGSGIELLINQSPAGHSIEPLLVSLPLTKHDCLKLISLNTAFRRPRLHDHLLLVLFVSIVIVRSRCLETNFRDERYSNSAYTIQYIYMQYDDHGI